MSRGRGIAGFRWPGALGAAALLLSGCGGGSGGGILPGDPVTGVIGTCASLSGAGVGYSMGTCTTGTVLESQLQPINAVVTIAPDASWYNLDLGAILGSHLFSNPADASISNTLGQITGVHLQKADGSASIGDFADARYQATGASVWPVGGGLSYTNFGFWERFVSPSEGSYLGGWYVPRTLADANVSLPISGEAKYTGIAVGAMAPIQGYPPSYGLSASLSLTANFSNNNVTGLMSNFQLSNAALFGDVPLAWSIDSVPLTVSLTGQIDAGTSTFTGDMAGGAKEGTFEGAFFGAQPGGKTGPAEIGGRFQFVTPDARQVVGAFGGRQ